MKIYNYNESKLTRNSKKYREENEVSTAVKIQNVTKKFGKFVANNNVNLEIQGGDFVSLLGPSGCGKTTLLSMILGIQDITEGNIYFDDVPVQNIPIYKRDVGMVFQNYALFPHMTVYNNVAFGLKMRKMPKEQIENEVKKTLSLVKLEGLEKRFPRELSGGQQQRVALARAIVVKPRVLLLDEPLSNLDAQLREGMRFELKRLHKALGITTIYVTHDQIEALSLSTKIAVMKEGVVQQFGTPLEIFHNPSNSFVAEFVGYANFLSGKIVRTDGNTAVMKDEKYGYVIEADISGQNTAESFEQGDMVTAAIKPEGVQIIESAGKDAANTFDVVVEMNDYTGTATRYEMRTKEGFVVKASELGYSNYAHGTHLKAVFRRDRVTMIKFNKRGK